MKFRFKKTYIILAVILAVFLSAEFCSAAFLKDETTEMVEGQAIEAGDTGGYDVFGDVYGLIQVAVNAFLSIIGVLLLIYMLYAGYHWMTARGEEEKVEKAKDTLKRAIIGAIIIIAAYAISIFVMARLEAGTLAGGKSPSNGQGAQELTAPSDGQRIINSENQNPKNWP